MKSKIKEWILNGNLKKLRELKSSNQLNDNDLIEIVKLAKNKGLKIIETILVNRLPNAISQYSDNEKQILISSLISEISEDIYCAGWYSDIEFELWNWIKDESTIPEGLNHRVIKKDLSELQMLSNKLQLWAHWTDTEEEKSIGIEEWKELVKRKKADNT